MQTEITLQTLNAMDAERFTTTLGQVVEHSPWVARSAHGRGPFATVADLHDAFEAVVHAAPREHQLGLIRAHPELAGREAAAGELSDSSAREQRRATLDRLGAYDAQALYDLNRTYRDRFGFPLIVCVREHTSDSIIAWGRERLSHELGEEIEIVLGEVVKIVRLRLADLVADGCSPA
jgi:2-oxo-4-hydroxy-4-carboxy-5-ureidoimidazoline decarboxylase